jgi:TonB-dependent SusC/RagA subfamily outer membrane receptor
MKKSIVFAGVMVVTLTITGFLTNDPGILDRLRNEFTAYAEKYEEEKVYVQFDKTFYKPGENIWFNVFLVNAGTHRPSRISDVVYVELINPSGNTIQTLDLFVKDGTAGADFSLSDSDVGGIYKVVAYTRWMKNFDEDYFFTKELQVQKVITPRMLLNLDFAAEAYGPGDTVRANLSIRDLKNEPVVNAEIGMKLKISGKDITSLSLSSDRNGKAQLVFSLPLDLATRDGILDVVISSAGRQESISRSVPIVLNKISLSFYPEGGDMIAGSSARVAFMAVNEFGKGADVAGEILNQSGDVVATFESFHMGMGSVELNPVATMTYNARITRPAGIEKLYPLPAVKPGLSLRATTRGETLSFSIHAPESSDAFLIGQSHGILYYANQIRVNRGVNEITVNSNNFPAGIAVFTLFNAQGLEEAERLVFLNEEKQLNISVETDRKDYVPRGKVRVTVTTTDERGRPVPAKLSLSAVDDQILSFADDKQDNILSWLFLSSELKGKIQEPSFYFDRDEPKRKEALDYLMMTHGWRRFTWKDVLFVDRNLVFVPEQLSWVSGEIIGKSGAPLQQDVMLLELNARRRMAKVKTTKEGGFVFKNVDASSPVLLLTATPAQINLSRANRERPSDVASLRDRHQDGLKRGEVEVELQEAEPDLNKPAVVEGDLAMKDLKMEADVSSLSEIVVVGYGVERKQDLTGAVSSVQSNDLSGAQALSSVENILQGRVAGVTVQKNGGVSAPSIRIRGTSSLSSSNEPLYVIDGQPMSGSLSSNFGNGTILDPEDIESIEVLRGPELAGLFGSRASNGVVLIKTRSGLNQGWFRTGARNSKYSTRLITPRTFSVSREFFRESPTASYPQRADFATTVYWNQTLVTDASGKATVTFLANDATSLFRITAEGITASGLVGRGEGVYASHLPISMDTKIPEYLSFEDTLRLPITIKNSTTAAIGATLTIKVDNGLRSLDGTTARINVDAGQSFTHYARIVSAAKEGKFPISITLQGEGVSDDIQQTINVMPIGFPMKLSFSSQDLSKTLRFTIRDLERGSLKGEVIAYPDVLTDLLSGLEAMISEPHGCFEQVSSSTFPNILVLQFMRERGDIRREVEAEALKYIRDGYSKLAGYEVDGGGFEWFGHPAAHEGLTAFGLIEFMEMSKVYNGVDQEMVARARNWLLKRRKGDGSFEYSRGLDDFSSASNAVNNAYIAYALAETGVTDIDKEFNTMYNEAVTNRDSYRMALAANAAFKLNKIAEYKTLTQYFVNEVRTHGLDGLKSEHSVVRSYGRSLEIEAISLWASALMKSNEGDRVVLNQLIKNIIENRSFGDFGSTQGTVVALKALLDFTKLSKKIRDGGEMRLSVNDRGMDAKSFDEHMRDAISFGGFEDYLQEGKNEMKVSFTNSTQALPYSVNLQWYTRTPASHSNTKVIISTKLGQSKVKMNATVRLTTVLENVSSEGQPMTMALIGIPAGLSLQPWQLKEMQEQHAFDFYEIMGDRIALYYRQFKPQEKRIIHLDLKAEIPGYFKGAASTAYLYYTDEIKHWVAGTEITVLP